MKEGGTARCADAIPYSGSIARGRGPTDRPSWAELHEEEQAAAHNVPMADCAALEDSQVLASAEAAALVVQMAACAPIEDSQVLVTAEAAAHDVQMAACASLDDGQVLVTAEAAAHDGQTAECAPLEDSQVLATAEAAALDVQLAACAQLDDSQVLGTAEAAAHSVQMAACDPLEHSQVLVMAEAAAHVQRDAGATEDSQVLATEAARSEQMSARELEDSRRREFLAMLARLRAFTERLRAMPVLLGSDVTARDMAWEFVQAECGRMAQARDSRM